MRRKPTPLLFLIAVTSVRAQDECLSLSNSQACPSFAQYYVGLNDLASRYTYLQNATDLNSLDASLIQYASSGQDYLAPLGCSGQAGYARYSLTRLCASLVQDANSLSCNYNNNQSPSPMCQSTCDAWLDSITSLTTDDSSCGGSSGWSAALANLASQCASWPGYNGTSNCISGSQNEPDHCGFQNNTDAACDYCKANGTDSCCSSISSSCQANLSAGAIAGIVIGSVAAAALCALAAFFFCHRRKRVRKDNFWFTTYVRPKDHYAHTAYAIDPRNPSSLNQQSLIHHNHNNNSNIQPTSPTEPPSPLTPITTAAVSSKQDDFANIPLNGGRTSPPVPPITTTVYPDVFGDDPPPTTEEDEGEGGAFLAQPKADDMYIVVHPYPPQMGDELALHNGDIICLALNFDDGWALGFNAMTGLKGAFPTVCVAPIPPEMLDEMAFAQIQQQHQMQGDEPSSKTLIEDDEERNPFREPENPFANPRDPWQASDERKRAEPKYSLHEMNRIRESVRRSMSLGTFNLPSSSSMTQHSRIPKRTASMRTTYGYSEAESPTSPTHNTPFFDVTSPSSAVVRPRNPPSARKNHQHHHPPPPHHHHQPQQQQQQQQQQEDIYELHEQQHDRSYNHHRKDSSSSSSSIKSPWTNG